MSSKNYYEILGIQESATTADIKKAFRELAKKFHPDKNPGNKHAEERFKEINEAHEVLSDPKKRQKYDNFRRYGNFTPPDMGGSGQRSTRQNPFRDVRNPGASDFSFSDLFAQFFDRSGWGKKHEESHFNKYSDLETEVDIPFSVAINGGEVRVTYNRRQVCTYCDGSGAEPDTPVTRCQICNGTGAVTEDSGDFSFSRPCPNCLGRGTVISKPCRQCGGNGVIAVPTTINLKIPKGIEAGTTLRVRGQGEIGPEGTVPGDLLVTISIEKDQFFTRKGSEIHVNVPINFVQATLGTKVRVRTINENRVVLRIPPGTQEGKIFRLRGMGIDVGGVKGDMFVTVHVTIPTELTKEAKALLVKFAELTGLKY